MESDLSYGNKATGSHKYFSASSTCRSVGFTATHDAYQVLAASGYATEQQRARFFAVGRGLYDGQHVDAVVLGGTDLFLAFDGYDCGFPVIDSAQVHIAALSRASLDSNSAKEK